MADNAHVSGPSLHLFNILYWLRHSQCLTTDLRKVSFIKIKKCNNQKVEELFCQSNSILCHPLQPLKYAALISANVLQQAVSRMDILDFTLKMHSTFLNKV